MNLGRSYKTFGTKIVPVFRANSGCLLGTKWQKCWIHKNVRSIVKIVHSAMGHIESKRFQEIFGNFKLAKIGPLCSLLIEQKSL